MEARQRQVWDSIENSLSVLHQPMFAGPAFAASRLRLEKEVKAIAALHAEQYTNRHTGIDGAQIDRLKKELRKWLLRVSRNGAVVLEGLPGIEDDLRVPHANAKTVDLLDAAARIAKNARPHAKTLRAAGLPKDFIAQIESAAKALAAASANTDTVISRRSRATSSLPDALRRGRKVVRAIDATVKAEFARDSVARKLWDNASRIPGKIGRPKKRRPRDES